MNSLALLLKNITLSHIVAATENHVIGWRGKMPWHLPEDLRFFRKKTQGHSMILGRKTYESIGKPLRNRLNVILTKKGVESLTPSPLILLASSLKEAIQKCIDQKAQYGSEIFIIGGGEVFKESLPLIHKIYLTRIHAEMEGDAFYPKIDLSQFKKLKERAGKHSKTRKEQNKKQSLKKQPLNKEENAASPSYTFLEYERKNRLKK